MSRRTVMLAVVVLAGCRPAAIDDGAANPTLQSTSLTLPADMAVLPPGPHRDVVEANCLACHSAEMITTQPPLRPGQWAATVKKMRETYQAPIAPGDDAAIVAYLSASASVPPPRP